MLRGNLATIARLRIVAPVALLSLLAACGTRPSSTAYHGGGHYGGPTRYYPPPGPASDPWGPYVREAAARYHLPEQWIREVMRQESGGREDAVSGSGAMGLMQIMPSTYDYLRSRYGLGGDPFEPHDNIMGGTAYLAELYNQFGTPAFLAAYNAGPNRLARYLAGNATLPDETVNYVASIAPRLGNAVAPTGPLAVYAQSSGGRQTYASSYPVIVAGSSGNGCNPDAAYDPSRPCAPMRPVAPQPVATPVAPVSQVAISAVPSPALDPCDPDAAYDPSRTCSQIAPQPVQSVVQPPVTQATLAPVAVAAAPRSNLYQPAAYTPPAQSAPSAVPAAVASVAPASGAWSIQVGAFGSATQARLVAGGVQESMPELLSSARIELPPTTPFGGAVLYRARLSHLSSDVANTACVRLVARQQPCHVVAPGQSS